MKIQPGQVLIGREKLASILGLSSRNIRTALKLLKTTGITTSETTSHFSIITIVKWVDYQGQPQKVTSETTSEVTNSRPAGDQQVTTEQEHKNIRTQEEKKTDTAAPYVAAWMDAWKIKYPNTPCAREGRAIGSLQRELAQLGGLDEFKRRVSNYLHDPYKQSHTLFDLVQDYNKYAVRREKTANMLKAEDDAAKLQREAEFKKREREIVRRQRSE